MSDLNAMRWTRGPGHYEVWYLTLTDGGSGAGAWIRYTLLAPDSGTASCSLWCSVMTPGGDVVGRKATWPADRLRAGQDPFRLEIADAVLTDGEARGGFEDVAWDLRWAPGPAGRRHVHPVLERLRLAKTVLTLPHPAVAVAGTLRVGDRTIELTGARAGQAHLWGTKHATRWAWAHCNAFATADGEPVDDFVDGASVFVPRLGRQIGPSTPVVGRFAGEDFAAVSPLEVLRTDSRFGLTSWSFEARAGKRKIAGVVDARPQTLVGVTYTDPDGEQAYCYNSEVASMRLSVSDRAAGRRGGWLVRRTLVADGTAHFEYAQRAPVPGQALHVR